MITIMMAVAFILFALATFWRPEPARANLTAAGLAVWVLAEILGHTVLH